MPGITSADRAEIARRLAAREVAAALRVLAAYRQLDEDELPAVRPATLRALAADPTAARELVLAVAAPSAAVRRFAARLVPSLGPPAAALLLDLALASLEPFRPGRASLAALGSFDGFASPVAAHAVAAGASFEDEAEQYARAVVADLVEALADARPAGLLRLYELSQAEVRAQLRAAMQADRSGADEEVPTLRLHDVVVREAPALLQGDEHAWAEATLRWARGQLALDLPPADAAELALADRFGALGAEVQAELRRHAAHGLARFDGLPRAARLALFALRREALDDAALDARELLAAELARHRQGWPDEAAAAEAAWERGARTGEALLAALEPPRRARKRPANKGPASKRKTTGRKSAGKKKSNGKKTKKKKGGGEP